MLVMLEGLQELETAHSRHHDVKNDYIEGSLDEYAEGGLATVGLADCMTLPFQMPGQQFASKLVIVNHQDAP